ncbi:Transcription factor GTE4 [Striga hermonthica]|uniref:Transcription factor GTE4 n=1 Tax=Striga hermonthica TaxID=68872 RepID=A0A9N7MKK9_STRHE|nr:Transcription factor GTE4 [Striga hermonthica]
MASETLGDSAGDDLIAKARDRWTEKSIVYTRRNRKNAPKTSINDDSAATTTASVRENPSSVVLTASTNSIPARTEVSTAVSSADASLSPPPAAATCPAQDSGNGLVIKEKDSGSSLQSQDVQEQPQHGPSDANEDSRIQTPEPLNLEGLPSPDVNKAQNLENIPPDGNEESGSLQMPQVKGNGVVKPLVISSVDDRIRFNLSKATAKDDIKDFRRTLLSELEQVSRLVKELEARELQIAPTNTQISNNDVSNISNYVAANGSSFSGYSYPQTQLARNEVADRRLLVRVNPEVGPLGNPEPRHVGLSRVNSDMGAARIIEPRPYSRQLSVAVMENNNRGSEFVEKEKRTPKANQFYRNSEFLLGKDRLPPENNKRLKTGNGRKHGGDNEHGFGFGFEKSRNQMFKNCSSLLQRLMKHKHGWVFNEPVDVKGMGLIDYHDIIKHPMDLGTIKSRLSQNWYKSPRDFAEDVRLVFRNAMTYNPKGQDVHIMAEQLSEVFEERWAIIEAEYNSNWKHRMYHDGRMQVPFSRKAPPQNPYGPGSISLYVPPGTQLRAFDRPELAVSPMSVDPKAQQPHAGRTPVPKKPKAKDPDKRDMTYEEKQRLSNNLQGLPSEKLDAIVQIIKKRNTALSQHDDEIEVDIDSVDPETLWELDRFVTNYKKSLSKNKRKAELALQARTASNQNVVLKNSVPPVVDQIGRGSAYERSTGQPADGDNQVNNGSRSSSSSSSSSDSGSSSSDSDSDSSSADGSDGGHSPKS